MIVISVAVGFGAIVIAFILFCIIVYALFLILSEIDRRKGRPPWN